MIKKKANVGRIFSLYTSLCHTRLALFAINDNNTLVSLISGGLYSINIIMYMIICNT